MHRRPCAFAHRCRAPTWRRQCFAQPQGRVRLASCRDVLREWHKMALDGKRIRTLGHTPAVFSDRPLRQGSQAILADILILRALSRCCIRLPSRSWLPSLASVQGVLAAVGMAGAWCRSDLGTEANKENEYFGEVSTRPLRPGGIPAFLPSSCRLSGAPVRQRNRFRQYAQSEECPYCAPFSSAPPRPLPNGRHSIEVPRQI